MSAQQLPRQFEKLLKLLHQAHADSSSGVGNDTALAAMHFSCVDQLSLLQKQPAVPRAVWKKLLQQQVSGLYEDCSFDFQMPPQVGQDTWSA